MGVASFANTVTKNNRLLAKSISSKYFRKINFQKGHFSTSRISVCDNNKALLKKAVKIRNKRIIYELSLIVLAAGLAIALLFQLGNSKMSQPITFSRSYQPVIEFQYSVEIYNYFVQAGQLALSNGEIQSAQNEFQRALKIFPSGLKTNAGIALCLDYNCNYLNRDCQLADAYREAILKAKIQSM